MKRLLFFSIILVVSQVFIAGTSKNPNILVNSSNNQIPNSFETYMPLNPLHIESDSNLFSLAEKNNWQGTGTLEDPYVIENYYINFNNIGTTGIYLQDINSHLIIQNNYLIGSENGSLGKEEPNYRSNGIYIQSSSNVTVRNNVIVNISSWGIIIGDNFGRKASEQIKIDNNTIISNGDTTGGIFIIRSYNITASKNTASNSYFGLHMFGSENITVSYNDFTFNQLGIRSYATEKSLIDHNIFGGNFRWGISFEGIVTKSYYNNGTLIKGFSPNTVTQNDFISNNLNGYYSPNLSQAIDTGVDNNIWEKNYWDNYPNYESSSSYRINRSFGLNMYSYDRDPQKEPIRASDELLQLISKTKSELQPEPTNTSWYFGIPIVFLVLVLKRRKNKNY